METIDLKEVIILEKASKEDGRTHSEKRTRRNHDISERRSTAEPVEKTVYVVTLDELEKADEPTGDRPHKAYTRTVKGKAQQIKQKGGIYKKEDEAKPGEKKEAAPEAKPGEKAEVKPGDTIKVGQEPVKVTAVGKDGVTATDDKGDKHLIRHENVESEEYVDRAKEKEEAEKFREGKLGIGKKEEGESHHPEQGKATEVDPLIMSGLKDILEDYPKDGKIVKFNLEKPMTLTVRSTNKTWGYGKAPVFKYFERDAKDQRLTVKNPFAAVEAKSKLDGKPMFYFQLEPGGKWFWTKDDIHGKKGSNATDIKEEGSKAEDKEEGKKSKRMLRPEKEEKKEKSMKELYVIDLEKTGVRGKSGRKKKHYTDTAKYKKAPIWKRGEMTKEHWKEKMGTRMSEQIEKARTRGAKDIRPRRKRKTWSQTEVQGPGRRYWFDKPEHAKEFAQERRGMGHAVDEGYEEESGHSVWISRTKKHHTAATKEVMAGIDPLSMNRSILNLQDEVIEKARTRGAKDIKKRRRRIGTGMRGSTGPVAEFIHKLKTTPDTPPPGWKPKSREELASELGEAMKKARTRGAKDKKPRTKKWTPHPYSGQPETAYEAHQAMLRDEKMRRASIPKYLKK